MKLFIFLIVMLALAGCGKFSDGTSVWAEGLWIVPSLFIIGIIILIISGIRSSLSGSKWQDKTAKPGEMFKESDENISFFKTWQFKWAAALIVLLAAVVFAVNVIEK